MKKKQRYLKKQVKIISAQVASLQAILNTHRQLAEASLVLARLTHIKKLLKQKRTNKL